MVLVTMPPKRSIGFELDLVIFAVPKPAFAMLNTQNVIKLITIVATVQTTVFFEDFVMVCLPSVANDIDEAALVLAMLNHRETRNWPYQE